MHDNYKPLDLPAGQALDPCPCCGADMALWQYSESETSETSKVAMCTNGERFGPQDGLANEGCLLYMPPQGHYKATIREAVRYANEYARALQAQQRKPRWDRAQVLRATTGKDAT